MNETGDAFFSIMPAFASAMDAAGDAATQLKAP